MPDAPVSSAPAAAPASSAPSTPAAPSKAPAPAPAAKSQSPLAAGSPPPPDVGGAQATPAQTEAEKKEAAKYKFKGKVYGQDVEEELDDDRLQARLQKGYAFDKTAAEMADLRAKFKQLQELGKADPATAMKELFGLDFDEIAEKRITEKYRQQLMTEEELAAHQQRQEYEAVKAEVERYRQMEQQRAQEALQAKVFAETEQEFKAALTEADLPDTNEVMFEMARIAKLNLSRNIKLTPKQLALEVRDSLDGRMSKLEQSVTTNLKGEKLLKRLGDAVVKEVLRASLEKARGQQTVIAPPPAQKPVEDMDERVKPRKFIDPSVWRKKNMFGIE